MVDPSSAWLFATVRVLVRRLDTLEKAGAFPQKPPGLFYPCAPAVFPSKPPGLFREPMSAFANHHPLGEVSASHSTSVEKSEASASLIASVDHVGDDDDDDDFAELADYYGVKEYGNDQWTAYLERGVPPRDVAPHRSITSSSSFSATIASASPPMCNAPPVRKQVHFSSSASWTPQPQEVDLEATSSTYTFISRLGEYFEQYKEVVHVTDSEVAVKAIIDCFHHAVLDEQEARLPPEMQMQR